MRWAVATGLFKGEDGCMYACRGASRAEVATMLMRYITGIDSGK